MIVGGIMSGTSLDGIDVAIVDIRGRTMRTLAHSTTPYPKTVRDALLAVSDAHCHTRDIARLHFELPRLYAKAFRKTAGKLKAELIGCHGQTIYHESGRCTLQIGDGNLLASLTGVPVVSDFRPADIAQGGAGAPLVPFFDYRVFRHRSRGRVALNLGGIANITAVPPGARPDQVWAFDTGPANIVIDALAERATNGRERFDRGGRLALSGHINRPLLDLLLKDSFYRKVPPKTAGREQYGAQFVERLLDTGLPLSSLAATATAFTAATVATAIERFVRPRMRVDDLIAAGGGVHNRAIMAQLAAFLPGVRIATSAEFGVDPDAKEAVAFALMAYETWHKRPSNLPSATGSRRPAILGKICR
jgi:anhydro-N-acetylmuramic acid kinase